MLESMASGTPVVAVEAGGIPDILCKPGVTGFLYRSGDVAAAVAAVQKLVANEQLRCGPCGPRVGNVRCPQRAGQGGANCDGEEMRSVFKRH